MCVLAGLWIVFFKWVVPPIIESAYRGESLSFLNNIIRGQTVNPVDAYLRYWDRNATVVLVSGVGFWAARNRDEQFGFLSEVCRGKRRPGLWERSEC